MNGSDVMEQAQEEQRAIACVHMSIKPSEKESRMLVWMLRKNTKVELWKGS